MEFQKNLRRSAIFQELQGSQSYATKPLGIFLQFDCLHIYQHCL